MGIVGRLSAFHLITWDNFMVMEGIAKWTHYQQVLKSNFLFRILTSASGKQVPCRYPDQFRGMQVPCRYPDRFRGLQVPCRYPDQFRGLQVSCRYPDQCQRYAGALQVSWPVQGYAGALQVPWPVQGFAGALQVSWPVSEVCRCLAGTLTSVKGLPKLVYWVFGLSVSQGASLGDFVLAPTRPIEKVILWASLLYLTSGSDTRDSRSKAQYTIH